LSKDGTLQARVVELPFLDARELQGVTFFFRPAQ